MDPPLTLSLGRRWTVYERTAVERGTGSFRRELAIAQAAFYSGARGLLMVLDDMAERGDLDELNRTVARFWRQIRALQSPRLRVRQ